MWFARKLEYLGERYGVKVRVFESRRVLIGKDYIDEKIREEKEKIPAEHIYVIKRQLETLRLLGKKGVLKSMKRL